METPYVVCGSCAHQLTVDHPLDRCENCGAGTTYLRYFANPDAADDESDAVYAEITKRRACVKFTDHDTREILGWGE